MIADSTRAEVLLWLFVINLGVAFGAGLYEGRIAIPDWLTTAADGVYHWNADTARRDNTGLRGRTFCDNKHPHRRTFRDNGRTLCDNSAITASSGTASPIMAGLQGQAGSPEFLLEFLHTSCGQTPPE